MTPPSRVANEPDFVAEYIGWHRRQAVVLLIVCPAVEIPGLVDQPTGVILLQLQIVWDEETGDVLFDPLVAYKEAFRFILQNPSIKRIIIEVSLDDIQKNDILTALSLARLTNQDLYPPTNYYIFQR